MMVPQRKTETMTAVRVPRMAVMVGVKGPGEEKRFRVIPITNNTLW